MIRMLADEELKVKLALSLHSAIEHKRKYDHRSIAAEEKYVRELEKAGITVMLRKSRGGDIDAACALVMVQVSFAQEVRTLKLKPFEKAVLSDTLKESSGLTILKGKLLSFNDSGNPAEIYELNPDKGSIDRTYKTNAVNTDWEAITNDGENLYIGDFGNNLGNRKESQLFIKIF
ncbi:hypothetical protein FQR65_LT17854 [Abscondita terminalis]|nr:hypothetical protein FQR65_LT17854 [Abscondita terminalis]